MKLKQFLGREKTMVKKLLGKVKKLDGKYFYRKNLVYPGIFCQNGNTVSGDVK